MRKCRPVTCDPAPPFLLYCSRRDHAAPCIYYLPFPPLHHHAWAAFPRPTDRTGSVVHRQELPSLLTVGSSCLLPRHPPGVRGDGGGRFRPPRPHHHRSMGGDRTALCRSWAALNGRSRPGPEPPGWLCPTPAPAAKSNGRPARWPGPFPPPRQVGPVPPACLLCQRVSGLW